MENSMPKTIDQFFDTSVDKFAEAYFDNLHTILKGIDPASLASFVEILMNCREKRTKIFFIGNGGSASTASHFANDLTIGTRQTAKTFRVISLADNNSILTAIGNDVGFLNVFSDQIKALGSEGDVLVAISASGNSPNLIEALTEAKKKKITTIAITAFDGGELKDLCDLSVHVPTAKGEYGPAEDAHLIINHLVHAYLLRFINRNEP